jgi:hypothetical protein
MSAPAPFSSALKRCSGGSLDLRRRLGVYLPALPVCQCAIVLREVASYLQDQHRKEEGLTTAQIRILKDRCLTYPARPPAWIKEMP